MRLAANLSFLFGDVPFRERYAKAAAAGFKGVEFQFPYEYPIAEVSACLRDNSLEQVLFNAPAGNWAGGERGFAAVSGREEEFRASIDLALRYAEATAARRIHVMAGIASARDQRARATYLANLEYAAQRFAQHNITLLIEPLNRRDMPAYFLADFDDALKIIKTLDADNVRLQFDFYHRQILHGDVTVGLREAFPQIGHIQIAGIPTRNEPDRSELSLSHVFATLGELGYSSWIGCEYRPAGRTEEGLGWATGYLRHGG